MDYSQIIEGAKQKLKELMIKRAEIDKEIVAITKIIEGAQLAAQPVSEWNPDASQIANVEPEPARFVDKVRLILEKAGAPLLPTEIRDRLESMGVEASSSKHILIHVHKVLGRLFENDEVKQVTIDGKTAYRTVSVLERAFKDSQGITGFQYWDALKGLADAKPPELSPVNPPPGVKKK